MPIILYSYTCPLFLGKLHWKNTTCMYWLLYLNLWNITFSLHSPIRQRPVISISKQRKRVEQHCATSPRSNSWPLDKTNLGGPLSHSIRDGLWGQSLWQKEWYVTCDARSHKPFQLPLCSLGFLILEEIRCHMVRTHKKSQESHVAKNWVLLNTINLPGMSVSYFSSESSSSSQSLRWQYPQLASWL